MVHQPMPGPPPPGRPGSASGPSAVPLRIRFPVLTRLAAIPGLILCGWGIYHAVRLHNTFDPDDRLGYTGFALIASFFVLGWAVPPAIPLGIGAIRGGWVPHLIGYGWLLMGLIALAILWMVSRTW